MRWYGAQCDGDWEHSYGVTIDTLDNPGWWVRVDLRETHLEHVTFDPVASNLAAPQGDRNARWHSCKVEDGCFEGAGGVLDLQTVIQIFRVWAEQNAAG